MSTAHDNALAVTQSELQFGEILRVAASVPHIVYYRAGNEHQPLAVFLPGGGHLARVAYGHPGANPRDFVDDWLAQEGYGLLALSYPSDHAAFPVNCSDLSIAQWAASIAALIRDHLRDTERREFVILGWSMAGRSVVAIERALRSLRLRQSCFISLAATAPLPNLLTAPIAQERFTREGFWDASTRYAQWLKQVQRQVGAAHRPAIDAQTYLDRYVVNSPFALRGQSRDTTAGAQLALAEEIGAFAYEDYPPVAAIVPQDSEDRLHALTDGATWGALNVLRIVHSLGELAAAASDWPALRNLVDQAPQRLSRTVRGGHFFFIGEPGAMATVRHVVELTHEARRFRNELQALVGSTLAR